MLQKQANNHKTNGVTWIAFWEPKQAQSQLPDHEKLESQTPQKKTLFS